MEYLIDNIYVSIGNKVCSPGSHKMKASDHSICVVYTRNRSGILLMLAQYYISSTPCYVSKLQLLFFWLDRTERATGGACMCSRASCLGLGEPGDRGMEQSKRKSPLQMVPILPGETGTGKRRFAGDFSLNRSIPRSPRSGLQQRHSGQ